MEDKLQEAREKIRRADEQIAAQFVRRMEAVRAIAAYKQERGMPIYDAAREQALLARGSALIEDEDLVPSYQAFLAAVLRISKEYQARQMETPEEGGHAL